METSTARHTVTVSAVIHRADGTVENVGVISHRHANPIRHALWLLSGGRRKIDKRIAAVNAAHADRQASK